MGLLDRIFGRDSKKARARPDLPMDEHGLLVNAYATVRDLPALDFPHDLHNRRDLSDPDVPAHLDGFMGFVMRQADGRMTAKRYHLLQHIGRVRNQASFTVRSEALEAMAAWARQANAVLFLPDGSIRDAHMTTLLRPNGEVDEAASLPYPADAIARRTRTLTSLAGTTPAPPASMPPALGEAEVVLRTAAEVWRRALALYCVAAEAVAVDRGDSVLSSLRGQFPAGFAAMTPMERAFVDAALGDPDRAAAAVAVSWRFEALHVLLWALSIGPDVLGPADGTVDTDSLAQRLAEVAQHDADGAGLSLRPATEILDALDLAWRQHWIVRQAGLKGVEVAGLTPDVVQERHFALNWLTGFQNPGDVGWDETDTPT